MFLNRFTSISFINLGILNKRNSLKIPYVD